MLHDLNVSQTVPEDLLLERLEKIEDHTGAAWTRCKKRAVTEAVKRGILVLTGGPGTGKDHHHQCHDTVL